MINGVKTVSEYCKIFFLIPLFCIIALNISCESYSDASDVPECFVGTYLNTEGSGTRSLFTFTTGGNFVGASSTEEVFNFSTELGSWIATGVDSARAVFMDFSFAEDGELAEIARIDLEITFIGENCEETKGSFELRFFDESEDPLDVLTDTGEVITDTFTGEKIIVE